MEPLGFNLAMGATMRHVLSARPDAPVRPDPPRRSRDTGALRRSAAGLLRRAADRLEPRRPAPVRPCV
jgi:hypothetical protein